jgi:crotonobetainyl-CoA:carnitine CoA-transferase CaiB-like acyl-CoA transferase
MSDMPLDGIRVLDFTSMVSGPFCTRLLADCGAEVVKIESTTGDLLRIVPPHVENRSRYFAAFNCGKKSLVLDLKRPEDVETAARLAEHCDVLVENFRPGVMERIGLGYEHLRERHPGLVYASISGFGQTGPMAGRPAYAPVVHARSGFDFAVQRHQRDPETPPVTGVQIADVVAAAFAFGAIQTALIRRERTGTGDWVDISLMDSIMTLITADLQAAQVEGTRIAAYPPIKTKDDYIAVCIVSPRTFEGVLRATGGLGIERAPRTADENAKLLAALERWACERSSEECERILSEHGVPCARYETPESVLGLPHLAERGSFASVDAPGGAFKVNDTPFRFRDADVGIRRGAPDLDRHRDEILAAWLGEPATS